MALGWSRIEVVDDEPGRSAAGGVTRAGFGRMVAEACPSEAGAVAPPEVSRFARNSRGWQQLIKMCRVVDTARVDQVSLSSTPGQSPPTAGREGQASTSMSLISASAPCRPLRDGAAPRADRCRPDQFVKFGNRIGKDPDRRTQETISSFSTSCPSSAAHDRRCSGSSNIGWSCPRSVLTATSCAAGQATRPFTG